MGMKYKEVGGGSATGLGNDWASFLDNGLKTGSFGAGTSMGQAGAANPMGATSGIGGVLNDLLAGGGGHVGGALQQLIQTQRANDVGSIRSRFGVGGGTAFGTPGQYAESNYLAQSSPNLINAIGGLQMNALSQILPQFGQLAQRGIPQAEIVGQENPWMTAAKLGLQAGGAALGFAAGGPVGGAAGGSIGSSLGNGLSGSFNPQQGNFGAPQWQAGNNGGWAPAPYSQFQPQWPMNLSGH